MTEPSPQMTIPIPREVLQVLTEYERRLTLLESWQAETERIERTDYSVDIDALDVRVAALETWKTATVTPALATLNAHTHSYAQITGTHGNEDHSAAYLSEIPTHGNEKHSEVYITGVSWDAVTSKPSTFTPSNHGNEAHTSSFITGIDWTSVTGKPSTFPPDSHGNEKHTSVFITGVAWNDVTSKPSTFPPDSHGNEKHTSTFITGVDWTSVTGKPSTFPPSSHDNTAHSTAYVAQSAYDLHKHNFSYVNFEPTAFSNPTHQHNGPVTNNAQTATPS